MGGGKCKRNGNDRSKENANENAKQRTKRKEVKKVAGTKDEEVQGCEKN